jgi:hypothetical protein
LKQVLSNFYAIDFLWRRCNFRGKCRARYLTLLKGTYYTENPSIRFMFVTFQYYCICWMSKLPRLKRKHHWNYDDGSVWMCFRDRIQRQDQENLSYLCYPLLLKKKILKLTAFIKPGGIHIQA